MNANQLRTRIRIWLSTFALALIFSGVTAIPLRWELDLLIKIFSGFAAPLVAPFPALLLWVEKVNAGVQATYSQYPFIAYGTDWLAFGHIAIALAFIGPVRDPVKNIWVIEFGILVCLLVIPWAFIFGPIRGIPFFWRLIDASFGVFGLIPLWLARRLTRQLHSQS